jgi:membrane protease YdiL (CAAX protease family)
MRPEAGREASPARRGRLIAELVALYGAVPALIALFLPPRLMFPALFALTALGLVLLWRTPGFRWGSLAEGAVPWRALITFAGVTATVCGGVIALTRPEAAFALVRERPALFAMILLLYPLFSALPQELIFRPLFFRRYGPVLPHGTPALWLNGAVFSFAHLMYWSWTVAAMTFAGGLAFAWAYERAQSFPLALAFHTVAGWLVFGFGLGVFFYSGNVVRPF